MGLELRVARSYLPFGRALPCKGSMPFEEERCLSSVMGGRHALRIGLSAVRGREAAGVGVLVSWVVDFMWAGLGPPCGESAFCFAVWRCLAKEVCPSKKPHVYAM